MTILRASVDRLDPVAREIAVSTDSMHETIYVPPGCPVILNGQSVRLRVLQPNDRMEAVVHASADGWIAERVTVGIRD